MSYVYNIYRWKKKSELNVFKKGAHFKTNYKRWKKNVKESGVYAEKKNIFRFEEMMRIESLAFSFKICIVT